MSIAIINCNLIDVKAGSVENNVVIVIDGERIVEVVGGKTWDNERNGDVFDAQGLFVMPGLIDMHVHFCSDPQVSITASDRRGQSATTMGILAVRNLGIALQAGITTVRDVGAALGASFDVKKAWYDRLFRGSRPLVAGPMITAIGGHGTESGTRIGVEVCGIDSIRREVRTAIANGADLIKVVTCGTVVQTELNLDELKAAVDEAHWCGRKVASHAHFQLRSVKNSVLAGCDTIEHGCVVDDEVIEMMVKQGTFVCPTITVFARVLQFPEEFGGVGSKFVETVRRIWDTHRTSFCEMFTRGVPMLAGTDAGMPRIQFNALLDELEFMVEWGMPVEEALRAATYNAAQALDRPDLGMVQANSTADLIFLERNPLLDIRALRTVRKVMQAGNQVYYELGNAR